MNNEEAARVLRIMASGIELKGYTENWISSFKKAYEMAIKVLEGSKQGKCRTCRHRDLEDKKCDCGGLERQGCPFPVSDDYFCKFYERGGKE